MEKKICCVFLHIEAQVQDLFKALLHHIDADEPRLPMPSAVLWVLPEQYWKSLAVRLESWTRSASAGINRSKAPQVENVGRGRARLRCNDVDGTLIFTREDIRHLQMLLAWDFICNLYGDFTRKNWRIPPLCGPLEQTRNWQGL